MKRRFEWCDATARGMHTSSPYSYVLVECPNTNTPYAMTWCPVFCPCCGGKLTEEARERYYDARKEKR